MQALQGEWDEQKAGVKQSEGRLRGYLDGAGSEEYKANEIIEEHKKAYHLVADLIQDEQWADLEIIKSENLFPKLVDDTLLIKSMRDLMLI